MDISERNNPDLSFVEQQLKKLPLVTPSQQLDERVRTALWSEVDRHETNGFAARPAIWRSQPMTAVVGILLGMVVGFATGTSWIRNAESVQATRQQTFLSTNIPDNETMNVVGRVDHVLRGQTLMERAGDWERRTGQEFNVRTHVADARFEFCRMCHLAGG